MLNLAFELTRRCNLTCRWCAKGNPQNMDITKRTIDRLKLQDIFDTLMLRNYQRKYNCQ